MLDAFSVASAQTSGVATCVFANWQLASAFAFEAPHAGPEVQAQTAKIGEVSAEVEIQTSLASLMEGAPDPQGAVQWAPAAAQTPTLLEVEVELGMGFQVEVSQRPVLSAVHCCLLFGALLGAGVGAAPRYGSRPLDNLAHNQ